MTMTSLQSLKDKALSDIETKTEYDILNDEFEQLNTLLRMRQNAHANLKMDISELRPLG